MVDFLDSLFVDCGSFSVDSTREPVVIVDSGFGACPSGGGAGFGAPLFDRSVSGEPLPLGLDFAGE